MDWKIDEDGRHVDAILDLDTYKGLPVIVKSAGKYPQRAIKKGDKTLKEADRIMIVVAGHRSPKGEFWDRVSVYRADEKTRRRVWRFSSEEDYTEPAPLIEQAYEHLDAAAGKSCEEMRQELRELTEDLPREFNSIEAYEEYCDKHGLETVDPESYGTKYWRGTLGHYSPREVAKMRAVKALRRGLEDTETRTKRTCQGFPPPVEDNTMRWSGPESEEPRIAEGWEVTERKTFQITPDTPSVKGPQYLGHEGETGVELKVERT